VLVHFQRRRVLSLSQQATVACIAALLLACEGGVGAGHVVGGHVVTWSLGVEGGVGVRVRQEGGRQAAQASPPRGRHRHVA